MFSNFYFEHWLNVQNLNLKLLLLIIRINFIYLLAKPSMNSGWILLSKRNYWMSIHKWLAFKVNPIQLGCHSDYILDNTKMTMTKYYRHCAKVGCCTSWALSLTYFVHDALGNSFVWKLGFGINLVCQKISQNPYGEFRWI